MSENKPKGYLAKYGAALIDNGYDIVPIRRGSKAPPFDGWEKTRANKKQLREWIEGNYARSGVGILTRRTPGVDLDILDKRLSKHMVDFVQENFGLAPVRIGMAPKTLLLFRADRPFPKINSSTWEDEFGDPELSHTRRGEPTGHLRKVEILGDGQQFVSFAIHPDTGKPYEWVGKDTPATVPVDDLPVLTEEDARAIVAEFERVCAETDGYTLKKTSRALSSRVRSGGAGRIDPDDPFAADAPKVDLSDDELHARLLMVPGADDYETWLQIGMALFHQYDGEERGLELWHDWSQTADNYKAEALDEKWDTFDITDKGRAPVTARLIIKLAGEHQKEIATETFAEVRTELAQASSLDDLRQVCEKIKHIEFDMFARNQIVGSVKDAFKRITGTALTVGAARDMVRYENPAIGEDLPRWLEGWVYISIDESFYNIDRRMWLSTKAFNDIHGRHLLTRKDVLEGRTTPEQVPSHVALNLYQIPVVQNRMYVPGEDDLFTYNSTPYVNSYDPRNIPDTPRRWTTDEAAAVRRVQDHAKLLFRVDRDRELFLDALAFIVQNPGKRINWCILLQGAQGDGKSFFAGLLAACIGPENIRNLQAEALNEKFNAWAEGAQVVFCEEIKLHGHNRFDVLNKIKPNITNVMVSIRRMQTDWYEVANMTTYILTTNFRDALPLDDDDSRYFILFSHFQRREEVVEFELDNPTYFDDLFNTLEHAGALRDWLMSRKLSPEFNHKKRAPDSAAKAEMVSYSKSEESTAIDDILSESDEPDLSRHLLSATKLANEMSDKGIDPPYGRAMNTLLLNAGFTLLGRFRHPKDKDKKHLFWSRKPSAFRGPDGQADPLLIKSWIEDDL